MTPFRQDWQLTAAVSVGLGVGFSVLLMSVSYGVQQNVTSTLGASAIRELPGVGVSTVVSILQLLTVVVTAAMITQTAATILVVGIGAMRTRRAEIAIRRQSGVLRMTLVREFAQRMLVACALGGAIGEVCGIAVAQALAHWTVLPIAFTDVSLFSAFPVTVLLALVATLAPAWRAANVSPALGRTQ